VSVGTRDQCRSEDSIREASLGAYPVDVLPPTTYAVLTAGLRHPEKMRQSLHIVAFSRGSRDFERKETRGLSDCLMAGLRFPRGFFGESPLHNQVCAPSRQAAK
jgi:hypothetical protein